MADPDSEYTRLHISPFTPALLNSILPASVLLNARNISYHTIQTFPEKGYGYVDLPVMDAEKIKKRLSGSTLKGSKVRIEKAKPKKEVMIEPNEPERPKKEKKKRKRDELPGVDIGERQVKRGWTTPAKDLPKSKEKKTVNKSKYTTAPECLFKTNLPPYVASKSKYVEPKADRKGKKKPGKETVVHEFTKTTKYATFLRSSGSGKGKSVAEYVEGKGWVDEEGHLVEEVIKKKRKHKQPTPEPEPVKEGSVGSNSSSSSEDESEPQSQPHAMDNEPSFPEADAVESSDSDGSDDGNSVQQDENTAVISKPENDTALSSTSLSSSDESDEKEVHEATKNDTHSSGPSSSDSSTSSDSESSDDEVEAEEEPQSAVTNRSHASLGPALSIKIPALAISTPVDTSVHPLEALYKKPKTDTLATSEKPAASFSFFGADDIDEEDESRDMYSQMPLTPFTQKDFEMRGLRSAAPTPDTAHPNKRFVWPTDNGDDDDEEPEVSSPIRTGEKPGTKHDEKGGEPESEFQKWFWENRGNVDRSWKARRRVVGKEKRQRENRKRHDRTM